MEPVVAQEAGLSAPTMLEVAEAMMTKLDQMAEDNSISEGDYMECANQIMQMRATAQMLFNVLPDEIAEEAMIELFGESSDDEEEDEQME